MLNRSIITMLIVFIFSPGIVFATDPAIARALFTTGIEEREPVDELTAADSSITNLKFFTELTNFEGQTVVHRWSYNGKMMAVVPFNVKGPRWRVYSSKNIIPEWIGTWAVDVMDGKGDVLSSTSLEYTIGEGAGVTRVVAPAPTTEVAEEIIRAQFTSSIDDREPTDSLTTLNDGTEEVFFFCEIKGMADKKVSHRWIYNNLVMAEVPFDIGGPRWRVYSSKKIIPAWVGSWRVDIVDEEGNALVSKSIEKIN